MRRKVTFEIKATILQLKAEGKSSREIGILVELNHATVCKLLKNNFKSMGRYPCKNCGHPTDSELKICSSNSNCRSEYAKEFYKDRRRNDYLKNAHGITEQEFDNMYKAQAGRCAICNKEITKLQSRVDHDHATGDNRKLLCHTCNVGLGHFFDDPNLLLSAAAYVISHKEELVKE